MLQKLLLLFTVLLFSSCLSYEDLREMKEPENKADAKENLIELLEVLEEPCDDPNFFAHVMETAASLRKPLILDPRLQERYEAAFFNLITAFDLRESDEWEVRDIGEERDYLQALALQLVLERKSGRDTSDLIKKYLSQKKVFTKKQWLIYVKAVQKNITHLKEDVSFCNDYINAFFFTGCHFSKEEKKFFANQMDGLLNSRSAFLFSKFLKVYKPDENCLNSLLEYSCKNKLDFDTAYSTEDLLRDLATLKIQDSYQQTLRNSLYLKYLTFEKMNNLVTEHFNVNILNLNEQLLAYSFRHDFHWNKAEFRKNINLLLTNSRLRNELGLKTKESLMRLAPGLYALYLIRSEQDTKSFEDLLSLYKLMQEHWSLFREEGHFYTLKGQNYLNPYFLVEGKASVDLEIKKYIYDQSSAFAAALPESGFSPDALRNFTLSLQAYKLAEMDVFAGEFQQVKALRSILLRGKKELDQTLLPYLLNLGETKALSAFLDYLHQEDFADWQLMTFVELYEKAKETTQTQLRKSFIALLQKRTVSRDDKVSLHAVKLAYRLRFSDRDFQKLIHTRWPELKAFKGEE